MTHPPPANAKANLGSLSPWLELADDTELLCGNKAGFEKLAAAIDGLLKSKETTAGLEGGDFCFPAIQLQEREISPSPAGNVIASIVGYIFLTALAGIILLAVFGGFQLFHLIFQN